MASDVRREAVFEVYRVIDEPSAYVPTYVVQARDVVQASDKQITLRRSFSAGLGGVRFGADALGRLFFRTPAEAVRDFAIKQRRNAESYRRQADEADRALAWAEAWKETS